MHIRDQVTEVSREDCLENLTQFLTGIAEEDPLEIAREAANWRLIVSDLNKQIRELESEVKSLKLQLAVENKISTNMAKYAG